MEHAANAHGHGGGDHVAEFERARMAMWLFLASEIMMFGAFIAAYVVLWGSAPATTDGHGGAFDKSHLSWKIACFNTAVLILSSFTMVKSVYAISKNNRSKCEDYMILTAALGALFLGVKMYEYSLKFADGIGPDTNVFYGCYFLMTGFHGTTDRGQHGFPGSGTRGIRGRGWRTRLTETERRGSGAAVEERTELVLAGE